MPGERHTARVRRVGAARCAGYDCCIAPKGSMASELCKGIGMAKT